MESLQSPDLQTKQPEAGKKETISELARRHLTDENHTTTDDELKNASFELSENVRVDKENLFEVDNTPVFPPLPFEKNGKMADGTSTVPNPYDVLGS